MLALAVFAAAIAWLGGLFTHAEVAEPASNSPNVLLIITDDQRDGTVRYMPETERLFVKHGRSYPNAYVSFPLCCPSRASIYSGLYPHNHGIFTNHEDWSQAPFDTEKTIATELGDADYRTALFGKFFNGWDVKKHGRGGFQKMRTELSPGRPGNVERAIAKHAVSYLEQGENSDERPWLMVLSTHAPHWKLDPLPRYQRMPVPPLPTTPAYKEDTSDKSAWTREKIRKKRGSESPGKQLSPKKRWPLYMRSLYGVDAMNARVFNALRRFGESDETMAIYISDNGFMLGDHRMTGKDMPQQVDLQVPMMVRWPGEIPEGRDPRLAANVDLAPTIYQAAGIDPGYQVDGRSLLGSDQREWIFAGTRTWGSVLNLDEQYIDINSNNREYYDLVDDPYELHNDPSSPRIAALQQLVDAYKTCAGPSCP